MGGPIASFGRNGYGRAPEKSAYLKTDEEKWNVFSMKHGGMNRSCETNERMFFLAKSVMKMHLQASGEFKHNLAN